MHGSKVMTINTFHSDLRPSLWRWRAPADGSYAPQGAESAVVEKTC